MDTVIVLIDSYWQYSFLNISLGRIIMALIAFVVTVIVGAIIVYFVLRYLKKLAETRTHTTFHKDIHHALKRPLNFLVLVIAFYYAIHQLDLDGALYMAADKFIRSLMIICFFWFLTNFVRPFSFIFKNLALRLSWPIVDWLIRFIKIIFIFTAMASIFQIWGIQIGPIIAGMGLFSVALALGAQDLFKNLIAGLVILVERRFVTGDRIAAENVDGTVERIGFRSTRIRTADKVPVYVPNAVFSDSALTNYAGQSNRRLKWNFGLAYGVSSVQLKTIISELKTYIKKTPDFIYDDDVVYVTNFVDSSITVLVNVLIITPEYGQLMRAQQDLIFTVMELVENNGASFTLPSRSLYIEKLPKGSVAVPSYADTNGLYGDSDVNTANDNNK